MSSEVEGREIKPSLAELKNLFGAPPVLSSESEEHYYEMMSRMMSCVAARDLMEKFLVKDIVDAMWEMKRVGRHKVLAMERKLLARAAFQSQRKQRQEELKRIFSGEKKTEAAPPSDLVDVIDSTVSDIDFLLGRVPRELDHAAALQETMEYHEKLDALYDKALCRRNDLLEQLQFYRDNLGQAARGMSDEIIDGECSVIEPAVQEKAPPAALKVATG